MPDIYFKSVPFSKEDVTLALESGVDGIITEAEHVEGVRSLALCDVRAEADMPSVGLGSKAEEESIASRIALEAAARFPIDSGCLCASLKSGQPEERYRNW